MAIIRKIDFEVFTFSLTDDDLYIIEVKPEKEFAIENMVELYAGAKQLGGRKLPILVLCKYLASTNTDLMKYLAQEDSNPYSAADAFVLSSLNQKLMANFYLKIVRPKRPTRFFTDENEALKWLENYR